MPGMDEKHRQLLKEHREELLDININDGVVDHLLDAQIISTDERDLMRQERTAEERSMALLDKLPRKGSEAFRELLVALRRDGVCRRHRELADLLDPPASANSGSSTSSKKATSTSGSEPVKPAAAKPTPDAKKPVAESQPVSSSDTVVQRKSIDSGKNLPSDLGICPKCAVGELRLRKDVGGTRYKIGCSNFDGCKGVITFPEFVTDVSPAQEKCKCGITAVELHFEEDEVPEEMKQGYKGCINGNCDQSIGMQRKGWTIPKSVGGDGSTGKPMGSAMSLTGNEGATSPGTQHAGTSSGTIDVPNPSWQCDCGRPAVRLQVKKEGGNHGRWLHKCATEKCKLWLWEDEHISDLRTPSAASTSARQSLSSGSVNASGRGPKRSREKMIGGGSDGDSTPKHELEDSSVRQTPGMPVSDAYMRALRTRGAVRIPHLSLVAYGDTSVGKTALCDALRNRPHRTESLSTECVDFSSAVCLASVDGPSWSSVDDSGTLTKHLKQMVVKRANQDRSGASSSARVATSGPSRMTASSSYQAGVGKKRRLPPDPHPPHQETNPYINEVVRLVSSAAYVDDLEKDIDRREYTLIRVCDLAGQDKYRTLQDVLVSPIFTAYLAVFDASLPVTSPSQPPVMRRKGSANPVFIPIDRPQSRLDYLMDCLGKLHSVIDPEKCSVYCVGTKIDERQGSPQAVEESLQEDRVTIEKRLQKSVHPNFVKKIFFVDNTRENPIHHPSLEELRQTILLDASRLVKIPFQWLLFTLAAKEIAKDCPLPWITSNEALQLALRLRSIDKADDLSDLLAFQHALGHVIFFAGAPDHVIVKPDLAMRCIATLIVPDGLEALDYFPEEDSPSDCDVILYKRGILTEALAEKMWKHCPDAEVRAVVTTASVREAFFDLMKVMSISCRVGEQVNPASLLSERIMLLPSVAESPEKETAVVPDPSSILSPRIAVIKPLQRSMPLPSVVKLATKCMSRYDVLSGSKCYLQALQMGETAFRIPWAKHCSCFTFLILRYIRCGVLVEMETYSRNHTKATRRKGMEDAHDAVGFVKSTLCELLPSSTLGLAAICGCPSSQLTCCTPHQEAGCRKESCFHLTTFIVEGQVTSCPGTSEVQDVELAANYWLNLKQNDAGLLVDAGSCEGDPCPTLVKPDPWMHDDWPTIHVRLVSSMEPFTVRLYTYSRQLLTVPEKQLLEDKSGNRLDHNDKLLELLRPGGRETFEKFLFVLDSMGSKFEAVRKEMALLLH